MSNNIAGRIFDGSFAQSELEDLLSDIDVEYETLGWDWYDCGCNVIFLLVNCELVFPLGGLPQGSLWILTSVKLLGILPFIMTAPFPISEDIWASLGEEPYPA